MRRYLVVFMALVASTGLSAMDLAQVKKDFPTEIRHSPLVKSLQSTVFEIDHRSEVVHNYRMECDVTYYHLKQGKPEKVDLSGKVTGYLEGWFKASISWGAFSVIDFGLSPKDVVLKMSRDRVSYVGTLNEAKNGKKMARILSMDISGLRMILPEVWDEDANCRFARKENGKEVVYVCLRDKTGIKVIKKVCFADKEDEKIITKVVRYQGKQVLSIINYADYRFLKTEDGKNILVPSVITVNIDKDTKFVFNVKEIEVNRDSKPSETRVHPAEEHELRKFSQMQ